MAVTSAQGTSSFSGYLSRTESMPIFQRAQRTSVVQRLAPQVAMGWRGTAIPIFGDVVAGWVGEGGQKPATALPVTIKNMDPKKVAALVPVSQEVVRANPAGFMSQVRTRVGTAIGKAFDLAALYDQGGDGTAGAGPYSTWLAQTTKSVELDEDAPATSGGVRATLVAALRLLVDGGKKATGWALDERMEPWLLEALGTDGHPIWREMELRDVPEDQLLGAVRRSVLLNRPAWMSEGIYSGTAQDILAFLGDWTQCAWGAVNGISYSVSTEASVTINGALVSAFENNLVIIRAEAEYGWLCNDVESFVKILDAVAVDV